MLVDPRRHAEIDGSTSGGSGVSTGVGDVFTMQMHMESLSDYRTDNHVLEFEPERLICWTTARAVRSRKRALR